VDRKEVAGVGNLLLGVWVLVSPVMLGFAASQQPKACWNAFAVGVAMMLVMMVFEGSRDFQKPKVWRPLVNLLLGLWLMLSPWILGFETHIAARNSTTVAGILLVGLALWAMTLDIDMRRWMRDHHLIR
jgi:drug/metabolite transporter (DMT)-like permease